MNAQPFPCESRSNAPPIGRAVHDLLGVLASWRRHLAVLLVILSLNAARAGDAITIYLYSEYIDPRICESFERLTGTKVKLDTYEAQEEMLAKLQTGGAGQYDVIIASDVVVRALIGRKLVRKLEPALIPNAANVWKPFADQSFDQGNAYSMPYLWGTIGLAYRSDKVKGVDSWGVILDPARIPGPFVFMDENRSMLGGVLAYLEKSPNSRIPDDLRLAGTTLLAAKGHAKCLGFDGGVAGLAKVIAGEALVAVVYNGDAVRAARETPQLAYAVPKEGSAMTLDNMLVSAKSANPAQAHAFINYILDAKIGAQLADFLHYPTPNEASLALIDPADRANPGIYPTPETMSRLTVLEDLGAFNRVYDEVWSTVKAR